MIKIERESEERLGCNIVTTKDPATYGVEFSFPERGARPDTWHVGTWAEPAELRVDRWYRKAVTPVVGAAGLDLPLGYYSVFVRVTGDGESPVIDSGKLEVQ